MASAAALVFAGKAVATSAITVLVNRAFTYLDEYWKAEGVDEMKKRILHALPKIQVVFDVVNPERIKEESSALDAWLWQLRDAVEEADDALDEIEYYELKEKARDRKVSDWGSSFAKVKLKAVKSIKHASTMGKTIRRLTHGGTLKRLKNAVEALDKAAAGVVDVLKLAEHLKGCTSHEKEHLMNEDRETSSMLTITKVFGRQKEKELVAHWLTKTLDQNAEIMVSTSHLSVVSIVGHGGMGKTTLAQLICKDDGVINHFEEVLWACVSTSFDTKTIIGKILESAKMAKPSASSLEALQKILREKLQPVKFLLVLDDVWEDKKHDQWQNLFAPLREGKSGSKILLTTRMQSVADLATNLVGGETKCLELQGLEENENINLFNHHAFSNLSIQDYLGLKSIGEQIAKKMRGCPLITKVVGAHLHDNMNFLYWNNFLEQRLEHFEVNDENIMKVLKLSYYHLSTELQTCFRYCSILPQGCEIGKEDLVEMWMCSGLVSQDSCGSQSLQDNGEDYLVQLTRKSFFDLRLRKNNLGIVNEESGYYVMHDLMHDLAKYVSLGECAQVIDVANIDNLVRTVRHIRIENINSFTAENIKEITRLKNLRTIIINNQHEEVKKDILNAMEALVQNSKSLRLFQTELCHTYHFLGKLARLKHLRFIILQLMSPGNLCGILKLHHLTVLELHCNDVVIEPKQFRDLGNLDRLRYVTCGSAGFINFPVGRLTSLRVLEDYHVQEAKAYTISALKDLRSLRRLDVKGLENVKTHEEANDAKLEEKRYLTSLSLEWSECSGARSGIDESILENLEPHPNLKELKISGYNGTRFPNWIAKPSMKNLFVLEFKSCINLEQLPSLAELPILKHIDLKDLPALKKIGQPSNASGSRCLEFSLPPDLRTLVVIGCPELQELPLLPPTLVSLETTRVGLANLPRIGKPQNENSGFESSQLVHVSVTKCPSLTSLEGSLLEQKQYMRVLKDLKIEGCVRLESTSVTFEGMNQLRELHIKNCPELKMIRAIGHRLLPLSLGKLRISNCGGVAVALLESLYGFSNLTSLELEHCSSLTSLPSPDVFKSLKSLKSIVIIGCQDLTSLGGLGTLPSLFRLQIIGCIKLADVESSLTPLTSGGEEEHLAVPSNSLQIQSLDIDLLTLLLIEPLKSLCHTQSLSIRDASEMESFPERWLLQNHASLRQLCIQSAKSLESLPPSMPGLSALEKLSLFSAERLRSLPDLPSSLQELSFWGCNSELEKKCRENGSPEWNKISHIPRVIIGHSRLIMGKECSQKTYDMLW